MKELYLKILLILLIPYLGNSQKIYTPILEECDSGNIYMDVICTDSIIKKYLLFDIDTMICSYSDSSKYYNLSIEVNDSGDIVSSNLYSYMNETECFEYLKDKVANFSEVHKFKDNRRNINKNLNIKNIVFNHPPLDILKENTDGSFEDIYAEFEINPRFKNINCENIIGNNADKNICSQKKFLEYVYGNLTYPSKARRKGIEGFVVLQYVVDTTGKINDIEIVRDIGAKCGDAVYSLISDLNQRQQPFIPGSQNGVKVSVKYTLPIRFKLDN